MKKYFFFLYFIGLQICVVAQSENSTKLVNEGIALHDNGDYANAIKKYDAAIVDDPTNDLAYYEKSFSLYEMKKLEECIELSKQIIKQFPESKTLKGLYVQWGSALDDLGKPDEAIKVYDKGLKKFPHYFLLSFNKGITYSSLKEEDKAYECYQEALTDNPYHSSSYYRVSELLEDKNHIPAILSCVMYLILDQKTERAPVILSTLKKLINGGVKKTGDNAITITLSADMMDTKKTKKQKDNFHMEEMMYNLSSALDKDSVLGNLVKTDIEKFDLKFQLLINSISSADGKGFFMERYIPFFKKLKENNYTMLVSRLVFATAKDEANDVWLRINTDPQAEFNDWLKNYKWPE